MEENIRGLLRREITPELYQRIRAEWTAHSIAEDARDIAGLLATLTEDCVYEVVQEEAVWHGHDGATRFYTGLLTAFPDIHFDLQRIVIGRRGCGRRRTSPRPTAATGWATPPRGARSSSRC